MRTWLRRLHWGAVPIIALSLVIATLMVEFAKPTDPHEQRVGVALASWGRVSSSVQVRVNEVRVGSTLLKSTGGPAEISQGQFVVVNLTLRAASEPRGSIRAEIQTRDGTVHRSSGVPFNEVGFDVTSDLAYELPADQVEGAVLLVRVTRSIVALERVAVVDLGLTRTVVDGLPRFGTVQLTDSRKEVSR